MKTNREAIHSELAPAAVGPYSHAVAAGDLIFLSGQVGVAGAYARHGFVLKGDIARAMSVVRCMDLAEAYLFPKLISKKILKEVPEKRMGLLRTYLSLCGHILSGRA